MQVREIEARNRDGWHELTALVVFEDSPREEHRVWLRTPGEREPTPTPGDVFVPGLLPPALVLGEPLTIDAPVSAELLEAAQQRIAPVLSRWYTRGATIPIGARSVVPELPRSGPGATAAFFSGGVDSWYTLLRNVERIERLITIGGFEIDVDNQGLWKLASAHSESIAREHGKAFQPVLTNLRDVGSRVTMRRLRALGRPWPYFGVECYFGSLLVALGRFAAADCERLLVAASWSWEWLRPTGSHPLIEPCWSTPQLGFELDGCDAGRAQKLREIRRRSTSALSQLRVCHSQQEDRLNCGRCHKCVRTRLEMRAAKAEEDEIAKVFRGGALSHAEIRRMRIPRDDYFLPDLICEAEAQGDSELATTVRILQGERFHLPRTVALLGQRFAKRSRRVAKRLRRFTRLGPAPR